MMTLKTKRRIIFTTALALMFGTTAVVFARQHPGAHTQHGGATAAPPDCSTAAKKSEDAPSHHSDTSAHSHGDHLAAVNERGEKAMGFSQTRTTHHFRLKSDGGVIEVEANDAGDTESRDRIRKHLAHIAQAFAAGDFSAPRAVHNRTPPGASEMCRLRTSIKYEFEETERGGRVRIRTADKAAQAAVHEFLRFQIKDHQTGDPLEISN